MKPVKTENLQGKIEEPISFLILKEKDQQKQLSDFRAQLEKQLQEIEFQYQKEIENLKKDHQTKLANIAQICEEVLLEIEKEFNLKLQKEMKGLEEEWLKNKKQREKDFFRIILQEDFYD